MRSKADLARGWYMKGDSDLDAARQILAGPGPFDTACFHAQQAAEKYLKGFLAFHEIAFPWTHDVEELANLCSGVDLGLNLNPGLLATLSDYAVVLRYDSEFWPDRETAEEAANLAEILRHSLAGSLPDGAVPRK